MFFSFKGSSSSRVPEILIHCLQHAIISLWPKLATLTDYGCVHCLTRNTSSCKAAYMSITGPLPSLLRALRNQPSPREYCHCPHTTRVAFNQLPLLATLLYLITARVAKRAKVIISQACVTSTPGGGGEGGVDQGPGHNTPLPPPDMVTTPPSLHPPPPPGPGHNTSLPPSPPRLGHNTPSPRTWSQHPLPSRTWSQHPPPPIDLVTTPPPPPRGHGHNTSLPPATWSQHPPPRTWSQHPPAPRDYAQAGSTHPTVMHSSYQLKPSLQTT